MGSDSPDKSKISCPLSYRITKTLICGKGRKSETNLKIGKIKKALIDFANQVKTKIKERRSYIRNEGNKFKKSDEVGKRENNSNLTRGKRFRMWGVLRELRRFRAKRKPRKN